MQINLYTYLPCPPFLLIGCATIRKILVLMLVLSFRIMSVAKNLRHIVIHMIYYTTIRLNDLAVYYIIYPTTYNTTRFLLQSFIRFSPKNKITLFRRSNCILSHIFYNISCMQTDLRLAQGSSGHASHQTRTSSLSPSLSHCLCACFWVSLCISLSTKIATIFPLCFNKVCNNVGSNAEEIANVMAKVVCSICTNQNGAFADTAHNRRACLGTCRK